MVHEGCLTLLAGDAHDYEKPAWPAPGPDWVLGILTGPPLCPQHPWDSNVLQEKRDVKSAMEGGECVGMCLRVLPPS